MSSRMLVLPHLDPGRNRREITIAPGASIADMVAMAFPGLAEPRHVRVVIGADVVPQAMWARVRPRDGTTVIIRAIPGDDTLRSVLTVAVLIAAITLGQYYVGPAIGTALGATGAGATAINAAATATLSLAGSLLVNAVVPAAASGDQESVTSLNAITGLQNQANPGGVIPSILGRHRYAPPFAATPYTEIIGDDQYVIAAFVFGHGPLNLTNHQLGDTPIENFADVQIEVRQGLPSEPPLTLYPHQVIEDALSVNLRNDEAPSSRFTARDATEVSVDITFAQGLVFIDDKGRNQLGEVIVRCRQRKVGDTGWTNLPDLVFFGISRQPIRRSARWTLPERGQYEIELWRAVPDHDDQSQVMDRSDWTAIRSFRPESPFNYDKPVAMVALRIRASDQLNGMVNNYNAIAALVCPDWDAGSQSWITRETSNAASLARYVLQGPANVQPKTDGEIDLAALQDWHEFNVSKGLTYNRVHDYNASRRDVLTDICRSGRAVPYDDGVRWSIKIDRPQSTYAAAITPRNSWDFEGSTSYVKFPDGHRVQFIDATNGWNQAERIVPYPGIALEDVEVTEDMDHPGVTDPAQIFIATRRRQLELIHRPHSYTVSQDFESIVLTRMDLAALNHDILDRDHVAARVRSVSDRTITIDTPVVMDAGRSYAATIRLGNGSTIRRNIVAFAGETQTLSLVGDLTGIYGGELVMIGTTIKGETIAAIVKGIERGDNFTAQLTLADAAPEIDEIIDALVPPPWDGRAGGEVDISQLVPAVPMVSVDSSFGQFAVTVLPGSGSIAVPANYVISYRLHGGGAFATLTIPVGSGAVVLAGFIAGDTVDVMAHAVTSKGIVSADSDIVEAVLQNANGNAPTADSTDFTADSTTLTADHF